MNWQEFIKDTKTIQVPKIKAAKNRYASRKANLQGQSSSTLLAMLK